LPTSIAFGSVGVGQTASRSITIINFGASALNVTALTITGGATSNFAIPPPNPAPFSVAGQSVGSITVNFAPTSVGAKSDSVVIASNDPVNPQVTVSLTGTGADTTAPAVGVASVTPSPVHGGAQLTVTFSATDNVGVASYQLKLSTDGGVTFG